jgi:PhzF family phenazine biosynthesis protein
MPFCGHSSVGALFMIASEGKFGIASSGIYSFDVETPCGILKMEAEIDEAEEIRVAYETPAIRLKPTQITCEMIAQAAGFDVNSVDQSIPVMFEETNKDLYVVIKSLEDLKRVECDPKSFAAFSKQFDVVALCLVTSETFDKANQFHMRCFAPLVGIPEDPFTGSVLGGLTALVDQFHLLPKKQSEFQVEQGHFMERPGVVKVVFSKKKGIYTAKVFAQAVHCFSTEINLT